MCLEWVRRETEEKVQKTQPTRESRETTCGARKCERKARDGGGSRGAAVRAERRVAVEAPYEKLVPSLEQAPPEEPRLRGGGLPAGCGRGWDGFCGVKGSTLSWRRSQ